MDGTAQANQSYAAITKLWSTSGLFALATMERHQHNFESAEAHFIEAQNAWLKGDHTRLHPFNGGCMYRMGTCCLDQGKTEAAM